MKRLGFVLLAICLFAAVVFAQSTTGVKGIVTDQNGAVVPGATVKLKDTKTGEEQTTTTSDQGAYLFVKVAPGAGYQLTVTAQGFQTLVITDIALGVGITETHNAQLSLGSVNNTVTITSTGEATLNTTDASLANLIDQRRMTDLPIQLRNSPAALLGLSPGVVGNNVGTGSTNRVGSVTGSRADQGNITIDGIDANDQATGQAFATVGNAPIDAIQGVSRAHNEPRRGRRAEQRRSN
jgi:Carboxypeptidase regulatory-like domain